MKKQRLKLFFMSLVVLILVISSLPIKSIAEELVSENSNLEKSNVREIPVKDADAKEIPTEVVNEQDSNLEQGEIIEERTENTKVFYNGDGSYTKKVYFEPIHIKENGDENFEEISSDLTPDKQNDDLIETENTKLKSNFLSKMENGKYATFEYNNHSISFSVLEAAGESVVTIPVSDAEASYKTEENQIFHKDIFPGIDLRNFTFNQSAKEDIILNSYEGLHKFTFKIDTDLKAVKTDKGSISFVDETEKEVFNIPEPYMTDSNYDEKSGEPQSTNKVAYELEKIDNGYKLVVNADQNWLKDPERKYPVYIDPSTSISISSDTFVMSAYPGENYSSVSDKWDNGLQQHILKVGYVDSSTGTTYAYLINPIASILGLNITSATLNVYVTHTYSSSATGLWLDRNDTSFSPANVTWNTKPSSTNIDSVVVGNDQWANFDVTSTVASWANRTKSNYGFRLHTNGNGASYWKKVISSDNTNLKPYLSVNYTIPTPKAPVAKVVKNADDTGSVELSWEEAKDAIGYTVWVYNGRGYQGFDVPKDDLDWSTKEENIWPTKTEIDGGKYLLHDKRDGAQLAVDPSPVYSNSGGSYPTTKHYWFRVSAKYNIGESAMSDAATPTIPDIDVPTVKTGNIYNNVYGGNDGYAELNWDPIVGATGYKVWIYNGKAYEEFDVKNNTSWSTRNLGIWPTADEIANATPGSLVFHHNDKNGTELPIEPFKLYAKMGTGYPTSKYFFFRLSAYNNDGETVYSSSPFSQTIPNNAKTSDERLGLEDYWTYGSHILGDGQANVNVTNGNVVAIFGDASIYTRGVLGYRFDRTYNSESTVVSPLGKGWTFAGNESLQEVKNASNQLTKVIFYDEDGTYHEFLYNSSTSQFTSPKGKYLTLKTTTINGKRGYEILDKTGLKKQFEVISPDNGKFRINNYKDKFNNSIGFFYDTSNRLNKISELDSSGNPIRKSIDFSYTGTSNLISTARYVDRIFTYHYNADQTLKDVVFSDAKNPLNFFKDDFGYDALGRMNSFKDYNYKSDTLFKETKFTYQSKTLVVNEVVDNETVNTTYDYSDGNSYNVIDTNGSKVTYTRDIDTFAIAKIESDEVTQYEYYDDYNIKTLNKAGKITTYTYDSLGYEKTSVDSDNNKSNNIYDTSIYHNLLTNEITDSAGVKTTTTYTYNPANTSVESFTNSDGKTSYNTDQYGRNTSITNPDGTVVQTVYDDSTNTKSETEYNQLTKTKYNDYGDINSITDPDNNTTVYEYDILKTSQLNSITQPKGDITSYIYDQNGNFSKMTDGLGREKAFVYNDANNIKTYTIPVNVSEQKYMTTTFEYNEHENVTKKLFNSKLEKRYIYDDTTLNLTNVDIYKDNVKQIGWSYLYENDLLKTIQLGTLIKGYTYNTNNDIETFSQGNFNQTYYYNSNNELSDIKTSYSDQTTPFSKKETFVLDDNDEKTHLDIKAEDNSLQVSVNTVIDSVNNKKTENASDKLIKTTQYKNNDNIDNISYGSGLIFDYQYYVGGNIKEESFKDKITKFEYDKNQQLQKEDLPDGTTIKYDYDNAGNRTNREVSKAGSVVSTDSFVYNDANQVKTKNGNLYSYDFDGNLLNDENYNYSYNYLGQLKEVKNKSGITIASYEYDEENMRTKKIIGNKVIEYFYKNANLSLEVIKINGVITGYHYYIYNNDNYPLGVIWKQKNASQVWTDTIYYFVTNQRGDVINIIDNNGQEVATYSYDSFGNVLTSSGSIAAENPIRYAGYYYDQETKHYYLLSRYYDPSNGNFQSFDPILPNNDPNPISQNGYTYADNDPANGIDPTGQATVKENGERVWSIYQQMAILANDAYTKSNPGGIIGGWEEIKMPSYYKPVSGFTARIYQKKQSNNKYDYCIAYRGTNNAKDVKADSYEIGLGNRGKQTNQAQDLAEKFIQSKIKSKSINKLYFSGHSLGGYLSAFVESEIVDGDISAPAFHRAYTYNAPGVNKSTSTKEISDKAKNKKQYTTYVNNYRIIGDGISALNPHKLGTLHEYYAKQIIKNRHTMKTVLVTLGVTDPKK